MINHCKTTSFFATHLKVPSPYYLFLIRMNMIGNYKLFAKPRKSIIINKINNYSNNPTDISYKQHDIVRREMFFYLLCAELSIVFIILYSKRIVFTPTVIVPIVLWLYVELVEVLN